MLHRCLRALVFPLYVAIAGAADYSTAEIFVWVDSDGLTHISDDPKGIPDDRQNRQG